jgi:hypothetical protein
MSAADGSPEQPPTSTRRRSLAESAKNRRRLAASAKNRRASAAGRTGRGDDRGVGPAIEPAIEPVPASGAGAVPPGDERTAPNAPARLGRRRLVAVALAALAVGVAAGAGMLRSDPPKLIRRDVAVYAGLGAWIDTYDFVPTYAGPNPPVTPGTVDLLAARGVKTIYLQPVRNDAKTPDGIVDADLLAAILARAHAKGIAVVGWSTPRFADVAFDLDRLVKIARFSHKGQRFDGIAVDIEDNETEPFPATRSANLVELSKQLRAAVGPDVALGAIVMPPVQLDIVNPDFWPAFPWSEIRGLYDVWMPMTYWTTRDADSGWRDGERYTAESVRLLREHLQDPEARVHPIGGIADRSTPEQVAAYVRALQATGSIGGSLYDVATTNEPVWQSLAPLPAALALLPPTTTTGR